MATQASIASLDPFENIKHIDTGNSCLESRPCQHDCIITYHDARPPYECRLNGVAILRLFRQLGKHKAHFEKYANRL